MIYLYTDCISISINQFLSERINNQIRAREIRVISSTGENLGVLSLKDALVQAQTEGLDLVEVTPNTNPPIAKILDYGKYKYEQKKKAQKVKAGAKRTETKPLQIKIATGENDLQMKAKRASEWLSEGHRVKLELFVSGRSKFMGEVFLKERLERILKLITEDFKISEDYKKGPKGPTITIEKNSKKN